MKRLLPDTVQGQIVAILVGALLATFILIAMALRLTRPEIIPMPPGPWPSSLRISGALQALHAAPAEARAAIAESLTNEQTRVVVGAPPACQDVPESRHGRDVRLIVDILTSGRVGPLVYRNCRSATASREVVVQVEMPDDQVTVISELYLEQRFLLSIMVVLPLAVGFAFLLILLVVLSLWTLWRVNRPLRRMARTIERFSLNAAEDPLPESGPREFRRLAQAFNRMQRRMAQMIRERSHMLMAVGHDLRTPLTRLKLRIELGDEDAPRQVLIRELDLMHRMIDGALSFLNDHQSKEAFEDVDLGALVESICIEFAESGRPVAYVGTYGLICACQPTAMTRAVNNLIENACRYATQVEAAARREDGCAVIEIKDDGPGIPADKREAVLAPFARLDEARASAGGLGLGLAIVRDVAQRHGAQLQLLDADPHGLLVRLRLPLGESR